MTSPDRTLDPVRAVREQAPDLAPPRRLPVRIASLISLTAAGVATFLVGALLLAPSPAGAAPVHPFLSQLTGTPTGEEGKEVPFTDPFGLAIDASDDLWLADVGPDLIDKFGPSANFLAQGTGEGHWEGTYTRSLAFSNASDHLFLADSNHDDLWVLNSDAAFSSDIKGPWSSCNCFIQTAADNSTAASGGDLYVSDESGVYRIEGEADSEGNAIPADFSASTPYIHEDQLTGTPTGPGEEVVPFGDAQGLAVGSSGNLYVADQGRGVVDEFEPSGAFLRQISQAPTGPGGTQVPFEGVSALAADPSDGDVLIAEPTHRVIDEFDSAGRYVGTITGEEIPGGSLGRTQGLAVNSRGDVYLSDSTSDVVDVFGPLVDLPDVSTEGPSNLQTDGSATLNASVNPEGTALTGCRFAYVDAAEFHPEAVNPYAAGQTVPCASTPSGNSPIAVSAPISGLQTGVTYHYRVEAGNAAGTRHGQDEFFVNVGPFGFLPGAEGFDASAVNSDGSTATQAGSHPAYLTIAYTLRRYLDPHAHVGIYPNADIKDAIVNLPPGLIVNPNSTPTKCTEAQLESDLSHGGCPASSQIGAVNVTVNLFGGESSESSPLYNMVAPSGFPAQFGFDALFAGVYIHLTSHLRSGDYAASSAAYDILAKLPVLGFSATIFGNPSGEPDGGAAIRTPTSCSGPITTTIEADSWQEPGKFVEDSSESHDAEGHPVGITGCNRLDFSPTIESKPTTDLADSPSGLDFHLHLPQDEAIEGLAEADLKKAVVTLPKGLVLNPSTASARQACSAAQIGLTSPPGTSPPTFTPESAQCPEAAKIGTAEVDTPLLEAPLTGAVYLAKPYENPFDSLLAIYVAVEDAGHGVVIKLPGQVEPDPQTGQLTTTFDHNPQLPFDDFRFHFFEGARAPLRTPATCGSYETSSDLTPFSSPEGADATPSDSFTLSSGPGGSPCAKTEAEEPNKPSFSAGTLTPLAGSYSPLLIHLSREDGSQQIKSFDTTLPPGLIGRLAGIPYCPPAALAAAEKSSGTEQQANPSCPLASRLGEVNVGAGAGPDPYYVKGTAYLTGPYKGAPLSIAVITPALAGPFDLGTVVVRAALYINPETAQIHAVSDPLPQILDGIPLDLRSIALSMDRPEFTLNPTSCDPMTLSGDATSLLGQSAALSDPFQVGGCAALPFAPKLALSLKGATKRTGNPALTATLTAKPGEANIAAAQVTLPPSELLDNAHIKTVCTKVQFAANQCPAASVYGHATAITPLLSEPLQGPVYLGTGYGHELPDLLADLGGQIQVVLNGTVTSFHGGIRNSFEAAPDAPVSKFTLSMNGGKQSLLVNSTNLCSSPSRARVELTGQNGKLHDTEPLVGNSCKGKGKGKKRQRRQRSYHR